MSKQNYRVCFCFQRRFKHTVAEAPAEIREIFERYSENGTMTVDHFHRFIAEVQGEVKATKEEVESAMEFSHGHREHKHLHFFHRKGHLDFPSFIGYLFSDINTPLPLSPKVHHDMSAPLSHYFIYTGHNSYLTGNQLSSNSSDVPIIKALQKGVRVIELDMWPNSSNDDIHILHGKTLTAPVKLIKCLESIREHAFVASEYPVIITLEDHLNSELQEKVAGMITQTFGDLLLSGSENLAEFPSPELLKRKIIISTKPPKKYLECKTIEGDNDSKKMKNSSEEDTWGKEVLDKHCIFEQNDQEDGEYHDDEDQGLQQNTAPQYVQLIAIQASKLKGGVKEWLSIDAYKARRISLNEQKLEKAILNHGTDIVRFTQRNLLRVFPKAARFDSSNYNPFIGWMYGAQMVAFNMQGYGRPLWLMHGMFKANGECGYVKKPDILLKTGSDNEVFDPIRSLPIKKTLKVKVYMGKGWHLDFRRTYFDFYSPPDFYVKVAIAGVPSDSVIKKTKVIEDDWTPTWNEEFEFSLTFPELALLRIEVHEYDTSGKDDFGGQTCLPISELRTGIRSVPLHDQQGEKYKSVKLLMRFEFV